MPDERAPILTLIVGDEGRRVVAITGVNAFGKYRHASVPFAESEPSGIGAALERAERQAERAAADRTAARISAENENAELGEREPE